MILFEWFIGLNKKYIIDKSINLFSCIIIIDWSI